MQLGYVKSQEKKIKESLNCRYRKYNIEFRNNSSLAWLQLLVMRYECNAG